MARVILTFLEESAWNTRTLIRLVSING